MRHLFVAHNPDDGWSIALADEGTRHIAISRFVEWPFDRLLLLCSNCDSLHEILPIQIANSPGGMIEIGSELRLVPDGGQEDVYPIRIDRR